MSRIINFTLNKTFSSSCKIGVSRVQICQKRYLAKLVGSGPNGCNNRFPTPELNEGHNSLTITDPLLVYRNYVARGILKPDEQQFRAAVEFQKLYLRVKDYQPPESLSIRIKTLVRKIEQNHESKINIDKKFGRFKPRWFETGSKKTELIRVLTDEEELMNFPSPQGLLINGPVGSGKSLLMDIFASSLPHDSKCRWHYNNFMLWVYNEIHCIFKRRLVSNQENHTYLSLENEFILFEILQKMISKNTVLLLDEFMLPDIAAAKVVKILFTYFFKLGGVLVATSNRLPEELYSTDFNRTQFEGFLGILKVRCHSYDMSNDRDYRKILSEESKGTIQPYLIVKSSQKEHEKEWQKLLRTITSEKWQKDELTVYGRTIRVPCHTNGVVKFEFSDICLGLYGPGDYISIASNYHTFILDNVPIMPLKMRNEARRFITLLDALYESKCKLIMRSDVELDQLFFPEVRRDGTGKALGSVISNSEDVQNEEMFSKTEMALSNPYRPNISSYEEGDNDYKPETPKTFATNFRNIKKFTGEDEMFAYKRAVSRMNEMTGSETWRQEGKWSPIDKSMRPWEHGSSNQQAVHIERKSETTTNTKSATAFERAPSFKEVHFWALGLWNQSTRFKDEITRRWIRGYK